MIRDFLRNYKQNNVGRLRYHSTNTVTEPITLNEAKAQLRIDLSFTDDDTYITTLISVARSACENYLGYMLARNSKMNFYLDQFPDESVIHLSGVWNPGAVAISYYDTTDTQVIWASGYNVDIHSQPARIFLSDSTSYPDTSDNIPSGINIDMTNCGPVAADIPKAIHQSMLLVIGRYYELRQDVVTGTIATEIPKMTEHLLNPYRVVGC
tara:strand:- start:1456 stop:2085 length:630 start_codon:yes stop_codon:yes gene_type:complete